MKTHARRRGGDWVINGSKMWITNGAIADLCICWAMTDEGIRGFIIERGTPGFSSPEIENKFSLRASVTAGRPMGERMPDEAIDGSFSALFTGAPAR